MPRLDSDRLDTAFGAVAQGIERGAFPGAVAAVGGRTGITAVRVFGHAAMEPSPAPMTAETLFDLASLTKVVATTPAVLQLIERGRIGLDQPVREILSNFGDPRVTVRHLLTHTSGLPAWRGLYLDHRGWEAYTDAICATPLEREPGTQVVYSDLGFILLGAIVTAVTGRSLPDYCQASIFTPLGMMETLWLPPYPPERFAATETANQVEYRMNGDRAPSFPRWRSYVLRGETNDGNAFYGLDGVSSHAGLFSTVADLGLYAAAWLSGGGGILKPSTVVMATQSHTPGLADQRGLGWVKPPAASGGERLSPAAFGHTGFTGTSLWLDPEQDRFMILLTNRLHPAAREGVQEVRRAFHDAAIAAVTG